MEIVNKFGSDEPRAQVFRYVGVEQAVNLLAKSGFFRKMRTYLNKVNNCDCRLAAHIQNLKDQTAYLDQPPFFFCLHKGLDRSGVLTKKHIVVDFHPERHQFDQEHLVVNGY